MGFFNRKYFILTLIYAWFALFTALCIALPVLWIYYADICNGKWKKTNVVEFVFGNIAAIFVIALFAIMCVFLEFHRDLIDKNSSTLENLEEKKQGPLSVSYDMGSEFNWCQVMGKNKCLWPIPYCGSEGKPNGDGVVFPKKESNRRDSTYELQENESGENDYGGNKQEDGFENPLADYADKYQKSMVPANQGGYNNYGGQPLNSNPLGGSQQNPLIANTNFKQSYAQQQNYNSGNNAHQQQHNQPVNVNASRPNYSTPHQQNNYNSGARRPQQQQNMTNSGNYNHAWGNQPQGNLGNQNPLSPLSFNYS